MRIVEKIFKFLKMFKCKLFFCIFVLFISYLVNPVSGLCMEGIIGGIIAQLSVIKYQVGIIGFANYTNIRQFLGGGAIIAPKFVLTAAHCFVDGLGNIVKLSIKIRLGTTQIRSNEGTQVDVYRIHFTDYNSFYIKNDLAVVELGNSLLLNPNSLLRRVVLPEPGEVFENIEARFSGYGYNWIDRDFLSASGTRGGTDYKLRFIKVLVLFDIVCKDLFEELISTDKQICGVTRPSTAMKTGVCMLDGGGPLIVGDKVVGILSKYNYYCSDSQAGALYTKVSFYTNFIKSILNGNLSVSSVIHYNPIRVH